MDQVNSKSSDSAPSVPVGERISADAPPPSSMNDLEALDIVKVLSASGIQDFDPKVVNMLMEFSSRYIYEVLKEANVYRMHASRDELDVTDIRLAVQCRTDVNLTQPLPREAYSEICRLKNMTRLPLIPPSVEQQIPNFRRDARHIQDSVPAAADALRDSFTSHEMYLRHQSSFGPLKVPLQYSKQSQLPRVDPSMSSAMHLSMQHSANGQGYAQAAQLYSASGPASAPQLQQPSAAKPVKSQNQQQRHQVQVPFASNSK